MQRQTNISLPAYMSKLEGALLIHPVGSDCQSPAKGTRHGHAPEVMAVWWEKRLHSSVQLKPEVGYRITSFLG